MIVKDINPKFSLRNTKLTLHQDRPHPLMASTSAQDRIGWSKYTRWLSATSGSRRFGSGPTGHALKDKNKQEY